MPMTPKVSIVTPSFNQAAYLEETIRSVLEQDYPHLEYIIIDGNSTDGSQAIIRKYAGRLAYWVSEPDSGQSEAINKGLARATGDILTWLCSDDTLLPGAVTTIVKLFARHPDAGLIYGDAWNTDPAGRRLSLRRGVPFSVEAMTVDNLVPQPAGFFTRTAWERFGPLNEKLHYAMDRQLWLRMSGRIPIYYEPVVLATMRRHPAAKGEKDRVPLKLAEKAILDAYFAEPDLPAAALAMKATAYGRLYYYLGLFYLQNGQFAEAAAALRASLRWQPGHRRAPVVLALWASARLRRRGPAFVYPAVMQRLGGLKKRFGSYG